jgi:hypothetical protein
LDFNSEFRLGGDLMALTVLYDERLHLRIVRRSDGEPWLVETTGLGVAL